MIPPATVKLGGGFTGRKKVLEDGTEASPAAIAIGIDTISLSDAPIHGGFGYQASAFDSGLYVDGGVMRRVSPRFRVSATTGADYVTNDGGGGGAHVGIQLEYASKHRSAATKDYDPGNDGTHNQTTTYSAVVGSYSIGVFVDTGFRWMNDIGNHGYLQLGLIFRLPIGAGAVDVSGQR